jgi:hypothetical protein
VVSTNSLETAGFLNSFSAVYITRQNASAIGTGLSLAAATNVITYVGAGPVVLFMNDWDDNLPTSTAGDPYDPNTSQLIKNAITLAATSHGYVGEFNGAAMALTTNANGFQALNLIPGSAGLLSNATCAAVTITGAGSVIKGSVPTNFMPTDPEGSCFRSVATGVFSGNVWGTYNIGEPNPPAIIGRQ